MPLFKIDLHESLRPKAQEISDRLVQAMVDSLGSPPNDRFHVFRFHSADEIVYDATFAGVERTGLIWIQAHMNPKYDLATRRAFFTRVAAEFDSIGIRHEDLLISVVPFAYEDIYPGRMIG